MSEEVKKKKEEQPLRELLAKINHPLLDVRSRTLRSVVFKVNNGIISTSDLVHEQQFLAHLLEWFNFEEWALESQVLTLISQLVQHEPAAVILVEIGGVEFLSQLRLHCDPSLHPLIDEILEHLLKLPPSAVSAESAERDGYLPPSSDSPSQLHNQQENGSKRTGTVPSALAQHLQSSENQGALSQSSQQTFTTESTSDFGSYLQVSRQSFGLVDEALDYTGLPLKYFQRMYPVAGSDSSDSGPIAAWPGLGAPGKRFQGKPVCHFPYSASSGSSTGGEGKLELEEHLAESSIFPWLRLSVNDCHILVTTNSRLESPTAETVLRSCEFISDVLLQDFPAELFLQRPALVKSLLKLLSLKGGESGSSHYSVLQCLLELAVQLRQRLILCCDPSMGSSDRFILAVERMEPVETPAKASVATGENAANGPTEDLEHLTPEMIIQLQSEQVSLEQFSHALIASVAPLLICYLNRDFPSIRGEPKGESHSVAQLTACVAVCLQLLLAATDLLEHFSKCQQRGGVKQKNMDVDLKDVQSVEHLASTISQCLSKWRRMSSQSKLTSHQAQLVCTVTTHLASCLGRLLSGCGYNSSCLPASVTGVLHDIMTQGVIAVSCPELHNSLLPYLKGANAWNHLLFIGVKALATTFEKMSTVLSISSQSRGQQYSEEELLTIANEALPGLWFCCSEEFIEQAMNLCLQILCRVSGGSKWDAAMFLLMKFLSHGSGEVAEQAYKHLQVHFSTELPQQRNSSSEENQGGTSIIPLVVNKEFLEQLCCHGAMSSTIGVGSAARNILGSLFSLREELFWPEIRDTMLNWLPFIEASATEDEHLCKLFQELLESSETAGIPLVLQLQSYLRLLFSANTGLRVWSFGHLSQLIISDNTLRLSPFATQASVALHDALLLGKPPLSEHHICRNNSAFKCDDVVKLLRILRSPTMDTALKRSALEQLAVILHDHSLHQSALEEGITGDLMAAFGGALQPITTCETAEPAEVSEDPIRLLKPCVHCLGLLVQSSDTLRKELSYNYSFLLDVYRAVLLRHEDPEFLFFSAKLLVHLLFAHIAKCGSSADTALGISLPEPLIRRLKFPFQLDTHVPEAQYRIPSPLEPNLLFSEPALSMLRLHYSTAMAGSINDMVTSKGENVHMKDGRLTIPEADIVALRSLHIPTSLSDCFKKLEQASSHEEVIGWLHHLGVLLQAWRLRETSVNFSDCNVPDWKVVLERFFLVHPATSEDMVLLSSVLQFLSKLLHASSDVHLLPPSQLTWLANATAGTSAICLKLLHSSLQSVEHKKSSDPQRSLQKSLLKYYAVMLGTMGRSLTPHDFDPMALVQTLCLCLDVAGSPNYYDLPLLESSLECLQHLTAGSFIKRPPSSVWMSTCMKLMDSLQQVLWSFISGRGSLIASFMGSGVTSKAALALCHLLQTTASWGPPEGWWQQCLQHEIGLSWIQLLIEDRDPKIRYAGLSLLVSLCSVPSVVEVVLGGWVSVNNFGLWGVCLQIALDRAECNLVRGQAFYVLVSLSAVCNKSKKWDQYLIYRSEEVTLYGSKALEMLLVQHQQLQTLLNTLSLSSILEGVNEALRTLPLKSSQMSSYQLYSYMAISSQQSCQQSQVGSCVEDNECKQPRSEGKHEDSDLTKSDSTVHRPRGDHNTILTTTVAQMLKHCSPHVVSGACQLLHNLLLSFPESAVNSNLFKSLISILDAQCLYLFLAAYKFHCISHFTLSVWVRMNTDVVNFLRAAVLLQPDKVLPHLMSEEAMRLLCRMFIHIREIYDNKEPDGECLSLGSALMALLSALVDKVPPEQAEMVFSSLQLCWESFTGLLRLSLLCPEKSMSLRNYSLRLFCLMLAHRFQPGAGHIPDPSSEPLRDALELLLDGKQRRRSRATECTAEVQDCSQDEVEGSKSGGLSYSQAPSTGSMLCEALLTAYDGYSTSSRDCRGTSGEKELISDALALLLACSSTGKQTALKSGLLESSLEQMKALHAKLCLESLDQASQQGKKKESPRMAELVSIIHLLQNFMYKRPDVKSAALTCHLAVTIYKLWPWCTVNRRLLLAMLHLLSTFTASYDNGRSSLASCVRGTNSLMQSILKQALHSITSYNSCSAAKLTSPHMDVLTAVFSLLANCALSSECRGVMKKMGILSEFVKLNPRCEKAFQGRVKLSALWIKLLANLSFSTEGQQMVIKTPDSLDILLDVYDRSDSVTQTHCLSLFRNLCFFAPSKALLASNERFLRVLSTSLDSGNRKQIALAASALWALLDNCSKIKNYLKPVELCEKLTHVQTILTSDQSENDAEFPIGAVSHALALLQ